MRKPACHPCQVTAIIIRTSTSPKRSGFPVLQPRERPLLIWHAPYKSDVSSFGSIMCHTLPVQLSSVLSFISCVVRPACRSSSVKRTRETADALLENMAKLMAPCIMGVFACISLGFVLTVAASGKQKGPSTCCLCPIQSAFDLRRNISTPARRQLLHPWVRAFPSGQLQRKHPLAAQKVPSMTTCAISSS